MSKTKPVTFGFQAGPVGALGCPDIELYRNVIDDCRLGYELGYDALWMIEHHFSDYYPTPSPIVFLSHLAHAFPDLNLGTCVLVTPWYQPIRLAGEIAMLSNLSNGHLHLGLGRGTAKMEFDAFDLNMDETRARFVECLDILRLSLAGQPFSYDGKFYNVRREVKLRPAARNENITFYGAIGSPASAGMIAEYGLPPLCSSNFPYSLGEQILKDWENRTAELGGKVDVRRPIMITTIVADSDDEAEWQARKYLPSFFDVQVKHYEADIQPWGDIKSYEAFARMFESITRNCNPETIGPWLSRQLVGSPDTVAQRLQRYIDIGFDYVIVQTSYPTVDVSVRHDWLRRFARDVAPRFSPAMTALAQQRRGKQAAE